jgi:hypothetical protein
MKRQFLFGTMLSAAIVAGVSAQTGSGSSAQGAQRQGTGSRNEAITATGCLMPADQAMRTGGTATSGTGTSATGSTGTGSGTTGSATGSGTSSTQAGRTGGNRGAEFVLMTSGAAGATGTAASGAGTSGTGSATGTGTGTSGSTASGTSGTSSTQAHSGYRLMAGAQQDLQQYANKRVEVRGTLEASRGSMSGGSTGTSATGSGSATGGTATGSATGSTATGSTSAAGSMHSGQQGTMSHANLPTLRVTSVRQIAESCSGDSR